MVSPLLLSRVVFVILACLVYAFYADRGSTKKGSWQTFLYILQGSFIATLAFLPLLFTIYMAYSMQNQQYMPIYLEVLSCTLFFLIVFIEYFFSHFLKIKSTKTLIQYNKHIYGTKAGWYTMLSQLLLISTLGIACLVGSGFLAAIFGYKPQGSIVLIGLLAIWYRSQYSQWIAKSTMGACYLIQITMGIIWLMWLRPGSNTILASKELFITGLSFQNSGLSIFIDPGTYFLISSVLIHCFSYPLLMLVFRILKGTTLEQHNYSTKSLVKDFGLYLLIASLFSFISALAWQPMSKEALGASTFWASRLLLKAICVCVLIASSVSSIAYLIDAGYHTIQAYEHSIGKKQKYQQKFPGLVSYITGILWIGISLTLSIYQTRQLLLFGIYAISSCLVPCFLSLAIAERRMDGFFYSVVGSIGAGLVGSWLMYAGYCTVIESTICLWLMGISSLLGSSMVAKYRQACIERRHLVSSRPLPWSALWKKPLLWIQYQVNSYERAPRLVGFLATCYYSMKLIYARTCDYNIPSGLEIALISALVVSLVLLLSYLLPEPKETYAGIIWLSSLAYILPFTQTLCFLYGGDKLSIGLQWLLSIIFLGKLTTQKVFLWLSMVGSGFAWLLYSWNMGIESASFHIATKFAWAFGAIDAYVLGLLLAFKPKNTQHLLNVTERSFLIHFFESNLQKSTPKEAIDEFRTVLAKGIENKTNPTRIELSMKDYSKLIKLSSNTARLLRNYEKHTAILLEILKYDSIALKNVTPYNIGCLMQALQLRLSPLYSKHIDVDPESTDFEVSIFCDLFYFVASALIENIFWYRDIPSLRISWNAKTRCIYFEGRERSTSDRPVQLLSTLSSKKAMFTDPYLLKKAVKLFHAVLDFDVKVHNKIVQARIQFF